MIDHEGRIDRLREKLAGAGVDALLVTNVTNVRYLVGFSGTNGQLLVTEAGTPVFFSDPRYRARARHVVHGADVEIYQFALSELLGEHLTGVDRLGIEATTMSVAQRDELSGKLDRELLATKNLVEELRRRKEKAEVELIRQAVEIGDAAFTWVLDRLVVGATERQIALDLEVQMRSSGAEAVSFPPIVGSGPLSGHIHHSPSDRHLERRDLILLDFGCSVDGYCSDLTRTVCLGPASDEQKERYETVLAAQQQGIDAVASDKPCREVDAAARGAIEACGNAELFAHGLGHGVGLDIHEAPRMNRDSSDVLMERDVVTVEPGIYDAAWGGIRIEDCVLVTREGRQVLGRAPKDKLLEV